VRADTRPARSVAQWLKSLTRADASSRSSTKELTGDIRTQS
jgi:hypothetical protein